MAHIGALRPISRYITANDDSTGKAVFSKAIDEQTQTVPLHNPSTAFTLAYATRKLPVDLIHDADIKTYQSYLEYPPDLVISSGSVLRFIDMAPGQSSPMHRTISLDYGVVIEGEVELILDSGEKRVLKRGDVAVQRGTVHQWRNVSETGWSRMMYVLQPCVIVEDGGKKAAEELEKQTGEEL
ncbi:cupin domain-containing protein [Lepidopterella palustris CBS 459.81]|uniref:Cupin domain-containing protein n=1 Tax=Lepidopterella palustris CBS 459.81 TaxID=1314670 RepID=A0A8E2EHR5_9PEZI|nr:cupin domain-containing protein [Lepidopterella palustris CBS 459.81]